MTRKLIKYVQTITAALNTKCNSLRINAKQVLITSFIIYSSIFVNCLQNEFKTLFDSENNFNNKWTQTKLKGLQIIDKKMRN